MKAVSSEQALESVRGIVNVMVPGLIPDPPLTGQLSPQAGIIRHADK